ncbi:MAG TPA: DNA recombination protein RmuC [Hyphomonadaceae bacterium]|nr:DNA recombination protein RmuC [Hyphomonadaceae bacterium]
MTLDTLHIVLLAVAFAGACAAFWFATRAKPDTAGLTAELHREREERAALKSERDEQRARAEAAERKLEAQTARMTEREAGLAREREQLARIQAEGEARFKALADTALLQSQKQFVAIADETLKKHKEGAQGELGKILKPIEETFGQFQKKVDEIQKVSAEDRAKLEEQIKLVGKSVSETREAASKLTGALTSPRSGGRWGEDTLRNVLEMAGLSPYADFSEQASNDTDKGRQRPDCIIRMPGGRELVVDSKLSLEDYLAAADQADPLQRRQRMAAHAARVRNHVQSLTRKEYWKDFSERVDFVAMFIPVESSYVAALEHDREIFDFAAKNNVIIVTPATLLGLAKAVAYGWRQEQMAKNAEQAKRLGQELYDRMAKFTEYMGKVGTGLGNATKAYNEMVGSFESRVLPATRKLEDLQFADPNRMVEEPKQIELAPRQLTLLDLPSSEPEKALVAARPKSVK